MLRLAMWFAFLPHISFGADSIDTCFQRAKSCKIDDSKYPPYNTFTNQLDADRCKRACLDQNDKGIVAIDNGAKKTKYCQLAVSRPKLCKLYYQTDIDTGASSASGTSGSNPVVFGPSRTNNGQGSSGYQGVFGPVRTGNQGNQWGQGRTQDGGGPSQSHSGTDGQGGDQCWQLQPGCPGYGGVGAEGLTTPPVATASSGPEGVTGPGSKAGTLLFDESLNTCQDICLKYPLDQCKSINYLKRETVPEIEPGICKINTEICKKEITKGIGNCKVDIDPGLDGTGKLPFPTEYYEKVTGCTV